MDQQQTSTLLSAQDYMLPCLNKKIFGLPCPGCGIQRSLYLLCEGEFTAAFLMYPAIYPVILLLLFLGLSLFVKFRYAYTIKLMLLGITVSTVTVSYLLKMNIFFN